MKTIKVEKFVEGIESIYVEQPSYQLGHDGSDGTCDCIGMVRGALERGGATGVTHMRGTNDAARNAIQNLQQLQSSAPLCVGDVVLKVRDKDDKDYPLPDKYRKGGSAYDAKVGETNFTHIGTVTSVNPLVITHMTSPKPKKDKSIKGWTWFGELPWVEYGVSPDPGPEPEKQYATVVSENGKPVKMREKPSTSCKLYWEVPVGSEVLVYDWGDQWSKIRWAGQDGYMMSQFLRPVGGSDLYTVIVPNLTLYQADALIANYPGAYKQVERG